MTRATPRVRARSGASVLVAALVIALLIPTAFLFLHSWNEDGDRKDATQVELDGVTYLRALNQLTLALSNAQTLVTSGRQVNQDELATAMEQVGSVDERLGGDLGTHDRWSGLRTRIEALGADRSGNPTVMIANFSAVGDLLIGLYAKVRDRSGLVHDPDIDAFYLQDTAATDIPAAVVAGARLSAIVQMAQAARGAPVPPGVTPQQFEAARLAQVVALGAAQAGLVTATTNLVDGLRTAVDNTESRTLGANLLSRLDAFQLASENVSKLSGLIGNTELSDQSLVPVNSNALWIAASDLAATILTEVETLLQGRLDAIDDERLLLLLAAAGTALLAAAAIAVLVMAGRRRRGADFDPPAASGGAYASGVPTTPADRRWHPEPVVSPYDDVQGASRWERSGATR